MDVGSDSRQYCDQPLLRDVCDGVGHGVQNLAACVCYEACDLGGQVAQVEAPGRNLKHDDHARLQHLVVGGSDSSRLVADVEAMVALDLFDFSEIFGCQFPVPGTS